MIVPLLSLVCGVWSLPEYNHFDMVEVNHKLCETTGEVQFTQVLAWTWSPDYSNWICEGWRMVDDGNWRRTKRGVQWMDAQSEWHEVTGDFFRETVTANDPERDNRKLHPEECRLWK